MKRYVKDNTTPTIDIEIYTDHPNLKMLKSC